MKKLFAIVLAISVLAMAFTACSKSNTTSSANESTNINGETIFANDETTNQKNDDTNASSKNDSEQKNSNNNSSANIESNQASNNQQEQQETNNDNSKKQETTAKRDISKIVVTPGEINGTTYINNSLGIKITAPEGWEIDEEADEYLIVKLESSDDHIELKYFSINITEGTNINSTNEWIAFCEENYNDNPDYMHTKKLDDVNIAGINFARISFIYPSTPYCFATYLGTCINGKLITINFDGMTDEEIDVFINNNIIY